MLSLVYNAYFIGPNCSAHAKVESAVQIFGRPRHFFGLMKGLDMYCAF